MLALPLPPAPAGLGLLGVTDCWGAGVCKALCEHAGCANAMHAPCTGCASPVQRLCKLCKCCARCANGFRPGHPALHGTGISWDVVLGAASVSPHSVCVHTEQSRWLALETRSRYCDKTPVKLQQKEIQKAAVTNAREKQLFRGGEGKKKKNCVCFGETPTFLQINHRSACFCICGEIATDITRDLRDLK